jgi:asparagine synthase (glutamine-hydrolysing)
MSGIAGIWNLDGRPVDGALLRRMTDAIARRGPDGAEHWVRGAVGIGHRMLHTTPESLIEQQPLADESGSLCLTLDGRVDNREDLQRKMESKGVRLRSDTDAELVLRAYQCWGEDCPAKIIGDFAFAIWDSGTQQLFCARDFLGGKPFYYYSDHGRFRFSSGIKALLQDPSVPREPNEGMIAEYLGRTINSLTETFFRGVLRLPPAHSMVVSSAGVRLRRYWQIEPEREIRHASDSEYAAHFMEVFEEAVRCRLRSFGKVGSYLSGGLDSSAVAIIAQRMLLRQPLADSGIEAFSVVFPGMVCDESSYIREVAEQWNIPVHYYADKEESAAAYARHYLERAGEFCDYPGSANDDLMMDPHRKLARENGIRVLLGGFAGDECLTGSYFHYADLLRTFRWRTLARQMRANARAYPRGSWVNAIGFPRWPLLRLGILPLLPESVWRGIQRLRGRDPFDGVHPDFRRRTNLPERVRNRGPQPRFRSIAQRENCHFLSDGWWNFFCEAAERTAAYQGVEQRYPFTDRRLVEFALAVPEEQRWRGAETKFILREAMRGLYPESVRTRLTKVILPHTLVHPVQELVSHGWLDSPRIAELGWIDLPRVRQMCREMIECHEHGDLRISRHLWRLWMILAVEIWYRSMFETSNSGTELQLTSPQLAGELS